MQMPTDRLTVWYLVEQRQAGVKSRLEYPNVREAAKIRTKPLLHTAEVNPAYLGSDKSFPRNKRPEENRLIMLPVLVHAELLRNLLTKGPANADPRIRIDSQQ